MRAFRFLASILAVWIGVRVGVQFAPNERAWLLRSIVPIVSVSSPPQLIAPKARIAKNGLNQIAHRYRARVAFADGPPIADRLVKTRSFAPMLPRGRSPLPSARLAVEPPPPPTFAPAIEPAQPIQIQVFPVATHKFEKPRSSIEAGAWSFVRPRVGGAALASGGQLGGSQIGMRAVAPEILSAGRWSLSPFGRLTSALYAPRQEEAALGFIARRPGRQFTLEAAIERRVGLGRQSRNAFAAYAVAGANQSIDAAKLDFAGYLQAGAVGARSRDAFVEGSATLHRHVLSDGPQIAKLGGGLWAGAQPGVARFDIGPSAIARIKLGNIPVQLQLDWRFRAAGNATPNSGPALTIAIAN